jgi:hypothetical protein
MSSVVKVTNHFGLVINKLSLTKKSIDLNTIKTKVFESAPLDENDDLISYGPHFGGEEMKVYEDRLKKLGLEYVDDYFDFSNDYPGWLNIFVGLKETNK